MTLFLEWMDLFHVLLAAFNFVLGVRYALALWRSAAAFPSAVLVCRWLPLSLRTASILSSCLVLHRPQHHDGPAALATVTWLALILAGAAFLPHRWRAGGSRLVSKLTRARLALPAALAGNALVAVTPVVGYLLIWPSPLVGELVGDGLFWGLEDKRWVVASYVFAVSIILVLPIFLRRIFELVGLSPASRGGAFDEPPPAPHSGPLYRGAKIFGALLVSAAFALIFFAESFAETAPMLDIHELVHLGSLLGIRQGLTPYLEAETQYGPGHQLLTYQLMEHTDFSLHGFRQSHLLLNLAAVVLIYFSYLVHFQKRTALAMILVSLWISPAVIFELYGWAVIPRWLGPVLTGLFLPSLVLGYRGRWTRLAGTFVLGTAGGILAWIASENLFGCLVTFTLATVLFWSIRAIRTGAVLAMTASYLAGFGAALSALFFTVFEKHQLGGVAELYFRTGSLVMSGFSNAPWGKTWGTWAWTYFASPYLLLSAGLAAVYLPEIFGGRATALRIRFLGLLSTAIVLQLVTLLRTDPTHLLGPSMALGAMIVLCLIELPEITARRPSTRRKLRFAVLVIVLLFYPVGELVRSLHERLPFTPAQGAAVADYARQIASPAPIPKLSPDAPSRLGFPVEADEISSPETLVTYRQWFDLMDEIGEHVAERKAVVSRFEGVLPSAVYFFADLEIALAVEPTMSVWTRQDLERWKSNLKERQVDCLVSSGGEDPLLGFLLDSFGRYSTYRSRGPIPFLIYCREEARVDPR